MRAAFAIAALAGSTFAAPSYGGYGQPAKEVTNVHVVVETVVQTVYVTEGYEPAAPTPAPVYPAPAAPTTTVVYEVPAVPSSSPVYQVPAVPSSKYEAPPYVPKPTPTPEAPKPSPAPAPPAAAGYMATVAEYRSKLGLKALTQDSKLESNAMDVVVASNGKMVHKLNPGTFAQVLAPAADSDDGFTKAFVGGWLCEMPSLPGLDGVCSKMSEGWSYEGQTGHALILTSPDYSKIGCANHAGIWCCDLA